VKFFADMGISIDTVHLLRDEGHDAIHLHEQGLDQLSDPDVIEKARAEGRILISSRPRLWAVDVVERIAPPQRDYFSPHGYAP